MQKTYNSSDPFTGMHISVKNDCWLGALTTATPDVDTCDDSALHRCSRGNDLSLCGELCNQLLQESQVLSIDMISIEVCQIR